MPISNVDITASALALAPQFARAQAQEENAPRENARPEADRDETTTFRPSTVTQISDAGRLRAVQEQQVNITPETNAIPPVQAASSAEAVTPAESPLQEPRVATAVTTPADSRVEAAPREDLPRAEESVPAVPVAANAPAAPAAGNAQAETSGTQEVRAASSVPVATAQPDAPVERQREAAPQVAAPQDAAPPEAEFEPISPLLRQAANDFVASFNAARSPQVPGFELVSVGRGDASILNTRVSNEVAAQRSTPTAVQVAVPRADVDPARVQAEDSTFAVGVARISQTQESRLQPEGNDTAASNSSDTQALLRRQVAPQAASEQRPSEDTVASQSTLASASTASSGQANNIPGNVSAVEQPGAVNLARHLNDLANLLTP